MNRKRLYGDPLVYLFMKSSSVRKKAFSLHAILLLAGILITAQSISAQFYFGKNKVQYNSFDWQVMTTEHFRIYFYTAEEEVARIAARSAEDSYRELAVRFNHEIEEKTPLIIYSSANYFSQTNIIPGLLPESVAGFTEFMKGRVVVPFHGSYHDFDHVIRHELVHVFTISKLGHVLDRRGRIQTGYPPLWFTEGIAESWSKPWDTDADMVVKDMVINGRLFTIPDMWQIRGTYFMYKLGESICHFIDSTYGPDKLTLLFENWYKGKSFDDVVEITLGENLEEVSRKWEYRLKKHYFPELKDLDLPRMRSDVVTRDGFSVKGVPIMWDDGSGEREWIVFKANRRGYSGIYMTPAEGTEKRQVKLLVKGERSSDFESLHLLRSGIDANNSGLIVFASKSKSRDVIYVYDLNSGGITRRYEFEDLVAIRSPRLSNDASQVVFSGIRVNGFADLYQLDLASGTFSAMTSDIYNDVTPDFSPDDNAIVFASDRGPFGRQGALNLFKYDLETGRISQLTFGRFKDQSPDCTNQGIYFSSDREGTFNLFLLEDDGRMTKQSTYVTGAFDPRLSPGDEHLVYSGYQNMGFQVHRMELKDTTSTVSQPLAAAAESWQPKSIDTSYSRSSIKYDTDYSLDIAQSSIGYDPVYGSIGGFQLALSDMLGNHAYHLLLTNTADSKDEFFESFNFGMTYINRERRLNWGIGAYHLYDEYFNDADGFFFERQAGLIQLLRYPVSKFSRIDLTSLGRYSKRTKSFTGTDREAVLLSNYFSWVYDNSLWDITGPIDGRRYNITVGLTTQLEELRQFNRLAMADIRHYYRLGRYSALANRLFAYSSTGIEPQRIYFGGSWSFRGFDRRAFYNRNVLFASTELRFPLIDRLLIGFPFGGLGFSGIRGALFFDVGSAWDDEFDEFLGSFGAGFRLALGYVVVLRFDFSRTTDFDTISPTTDFDFFFGWNF